jgi:hypothetical protein
MSQSEPTYINNDFAIITFIALNLVFRKLIIIMVIASFYLKKKQ